MSSVGSEFPKEQARLRQLVQDYRELPNGVGEFAARNTELVLAMADQAMASGDILAVLGAFAQMRECE